jgi:dCTP deaminase
MQLSDGDIRRAFEQDLILIEPFDASRIQPASYDVLLGNEFMFFTPGSLDVIDPRVSVKRHMTCVDVDDDDFFLLQPLGFVLGVTHDKIGVRSFHSAQIEGKSSLARLGLMVHITAGFIDPGNYLNVTFEFFNVNSIPIKLYPKMAVGQVKFWELSSECERPYGTEGLNSKYLGSTSVQASEMNKNFS